MNKMPSKMQIEMLRECYPKGMRVQLDRMYDDPYPIPPGTKGTIEGIDDYGHLMMKWDNGRTLSLVWDKDSFHKIGMENVSVAERYDELPESEKDFDRNTAMETLKLIMKLGFTITKETKNRNEEEL